MKKSEIKVGGHYRAKVSNKLTTVRMDRVQDNVGQYGNKTAYYVTNLTTGRKLTFRSAAKFRSEVIAPESRSRIETILKGMIAPKETS